MRSFGRQGNRLVRGFVLGDDRGGNSPALAHFVTVLARPVPNLGTALTTGAGTSLTTTSAASYPASVIGESANLLAKILAVRLTQIDLVRVAIKAERNRLCSLDLAVVR